MHLGLNLIAFRVSHSKALSVTLDLVHLEAVMLFRNLLRLDIPLSVYGMARPSLFLFSLDVVELEFPLVLKDYM